MKYKNLLRGKKGFTLVELVVSMAIMAILGLGSVGLLMMVSGIYKDTSSTTQLKTTTNAIIDYIKTYVDNSEYVEIIDAPVFSNDFARITGNTPDNRKDLYSEINANKKKVGYIYFHSKGDAITDKSLFLGSISDAELTRRVSNSDLYIAYPGVNGFTSLGVNGLYGTGYNYSVYFSTARYSDSSEEGLATFGNPVGNILHVTVEVTDDAGTKVFNYQTDIYLYNTFEDDATVLDGNGNPIPQTDASGNVLKDNDGNTIYQTTKIGSLVDSSKQVYSSYAKDFNQALNTAGITDRNVTEGKCIRFVSNLPSDN